MWEKALRPSENMEKNLYTSNAEDVEEGPII